jgi:hypothetical protein
MTKRWNVLACPDILGKWNENSQHSNATRENRVFIWLGDDQQVSVLRAECWICIQYKCWTGYKSRVIRLWLWTWCKLHLLAADQTHTTLSYTLHQLLLTRATDCKTVWGTASQRMLHRSGPWDPVESVRKWSGHSGDILFVRQCITITHCHWKFQ